VEEETIVSTNKLQVSARNNNKHHPKLENYHALRNYHMLINLYYYGSRNELVTRPIGSRLKPSNQLTLFEPQVTMFQLH
jgi:hypothetical protein